MQGDGIDIAAVYQLLTEVAQRVAGHDRRFDRIEAQLEGHDRRFNELASDIAGPCQTLADYHSSIVGHGVLITGLDERMLRVERHLKLDPIEG